MRIPARLASWFAIGALVLATGLVGVTIALIVLGMFDSLFGPVLAGVFWSLSCLTFAVVGALVVRRHPRLLTGWLFVVIGILSSAHNLIASYAAHALRMDYEISPIVALLAWTLWMPPVVLMSTLLPLTFPDGQLPSRRWRGVAWTALAVLVLNLLLRFVRPGPLGAPFDKVINPFGLPGPAGQLVAPAADVLTIAWLGVALVSVAGVVARFRRADIIVRVQLKWLVYATAVQTMLLLVGVAPALLDLGNAQAVAAVIFPAWPALLPVAAGFAILRYHLWDIDVIINRTLVYGALTVVLALVYVSCIVVSRTLLAPLVGGSEIAIVASTLTIAALFTPLRRRIQHTIDKRFYRRKYDAAKVLAVFSATVRDETDLERLTAELLRVVDETMQPEHVSLWLREPGAKGASPSAPLSGNTSAPGQ